MATLERTRDSRPRRAATVATALVAGTARAALLSMAALLLWAAVPAAWGWTPTTIQSDSMAPAIRTGDVIVSMPLGADEVVPGLDLLVHDPDHPDRLRFHRFVSYGDDGRLTLKGDANAEPDSSTVAPTDVVGVGVLRVPYIGLPIVWIRDGQVVPLAVTGAIVLALLGLARLGRSSDSEGPRTPRPSARRRPRRPAFGRGLVGAVTAASAIAVVVAAVTVTAPPASAAFASASPNPSSTLGAAATYDCLTATAPDSPFLSYRFPETTGTTAADSSGNGRTGTLNGGISRVAGGCVGGSSPYVTLDGINDFVSTPTLVTAPNTFSVEMWFQTTTARGGRLIGFGNSQTGTSTNTDRHIYMTNAGKLSFGVAPGGTRTVIASPISYNDGAWHHVVATLQSSGGMSLYVDGTRVAQNTSVTTARSASGYWRMGNDILTNWTGAPTSTFFAGSVDGAAVYTTALTQTQISAHYTAGR
ncbi:LamG-like jellyroll fold domain-containing protein [Herbiconiux sp. L3-i23]|uniref:LamG-like jellyroll fold domain-containing protein n=1 Tax=Herbiconiux sp. L3-i23 TaxID=2905871 RepID=UPI00204FE7B4|nr:LamG-like jellyroll fold domain-containing protein [Herbiconiux sp. L3-i23]BDI22861.1 hypothetical protein L3i23_16370 [Herbiconiux sp. L3-i23]